MTKHILQFFSCFCATVIMELHQGWSQRGFIVMSAVAALNILVMVSLFSLSGSFAPIAVINLDQGAASQQFIHALENAHHSFRIRELNEAAAAESLRRTEIVGIVKIPANFSGEVSRGATVVLDVTIDNVNTDLTHDIQRALPAAIVDFGREKKFEGVRAAVVEHDVMLTDIDYTSYLLVSSIALDAMILGGIIGALLITREWEERTIFFLRLAPGSLFAVVFGKIFTASVFSAVLLSVTLLALKLIYGLKVQSYFAAEISLILCVVIFTCIGTWLGALFKKSMVVVPLLFGLSIPLYILSGALEPARFDGEGFWKIAHISPMYYAVGVLEWACHGLHVTTESILFDFWALGFFAVICLALTMSRVLSGNSK